MVKKMKCIPIACGVIRDGNKFLILKRSSDSRMPTIWEFPGGKVELNENVVNCLKREVKEETNLDVNNISFLGFHDRYDGNMYKIIFGYIVESYAGQIRLSEEHREHKWETLLEILKMDIGIDTKFFIENFLLNKQL